MPAGSEDLVLKISADTTAVAAGLAPMTDALDKIKGGADATNDQLSKLNGLRVAPTVDDAGLKSAAGSLDALDKSATEAQGTLEGLSRDKVSPPVDGSKVDKLTTAADKAKDAMGGLADPVTLSVRDQAIQRAQQRIEDLKDQVAEDVSLGVDTRDALREISTLERSVNELTDDPVEIPVEVDPEDADFAFESMAKLKRGVRSLTDAALEVGDGVKAIPDLVSSAIGSFGTLNASVESYTAKQQAAGEEVSSFTEGLGGLTGFLSGPWALPIAAGVTLLGAFAGGVAEADDATKEFAASLDYQAGAMDRANRASAAKKLADLGILDTAKKLGLSTSDLVTGLIEQKEMTSALGESQGAYLTRLLTGNQATKVAGHEIADMFNKYNELLPAMGDAARSQDQFNEAVGKTGDATTTAAAGVDALATATKDAASGMTSHQAIWVDYTKRIGEAQTELDKLVDSLDLFNGRTATAREATAQYEEDVDALTKAIKENGRTTRDHGKTLDLSSEKGRANQAVIIKTAQDIEAMRKARLKDMETSGESSKQIMDDYLAQRKALYATAHQMGLSKTAAKEYVDALLAPKSVDTKVNLTGVDAAETTLEGLTADRTATVNVTLNYDKFIADLRRGRRYAQFEGGVPSAGGNSATPPAGASPSTVFMQPRIYLDSRPIRSALRGDVETMVADTYAAQTAVRRTR